MRTENAVEMIEWSEATVEENIVPLFKEEVLKEVNEGVNKKITEKRKGSISQTHEARETPTVILRTLLY